MIYTYLRKENNEKGKLCWTKNHTGKGRYIKSRHRVNKKPKEIKTFKNLKLTGDYKENNRVDVLKGYINFNEDQFAFYKSRFNNKNNWKSGIYTPENKQEFKRYSPTKELKLVKVILKIVLKTDFGKALEERIRHKK